MSSANDLASLILCQINLALLKHIALFEPAGIKPALSHVLLWKKGSCALVQFKTTVSIHLVLESLSPRFEPEPELKAMPTRALLQSGNIGILVTDAFKKFFWSELKISGGFFASFEKKVSYFVGGQNSPPPPPMRLF